MSSPRKKSVRRRSAESPRPLLESLEPRLLLSSTLYIDYGDLFPGGTLSTTVGDIDSHALGGNPDIDGPTLSDDTGAAYAAGTAVDINSLNSLYGAAADAMRETMTAMVERFYAGLDITVVELTPDYQNVNGHSVRAAADLDDISATLGINEGDAENNDSYIIVGQFLIGPGNDNPATFATNGYGGLSTGTDIGGPNANDGTALVLLIGAGDGVEFNGNQIAHEAGHAFGLRHVYRQDTGNPAHDPPGPEYDPFSQSDIMSYLSYTSLGGYNVFSRVPMIRGDGNTDPDTLAATPTPFDQLADDPNIGPAPVSYITGTGQNDIIRITKTGPNSADVSVEPFEDAAYTDDIEIPGAATVGGLYSYTITLDNPIIVDGAGRDDLVVIDGDLGVHVQLYGAHGTDSLQVIGEGTGAATVSTAGDFSPGVDGNSDLRGTVSYGATTIDYQEFEAASGLTVGGSQSVVVNPDPTVVDNTVDISVVGGDLVVVQNGTTQTYSLAGVTSITINGGDGDDTFNVSGAGAALPLNILGGGGNDSLTVDSSVSLSQFDIFYDGGEGFDTLDQLGAAADSVEYAVGPNAGDGEITVTTGGSTQTVRFQNIEPVVDVVPAPSLTVNGTAADNAISYQVGSVAANGLVTVDNFESIEFSNKDELIINGLQGSDEISLNNPNTPTALTAITVNAGDPTAGSDTVVVNGTSAADTVTVDQLTDDGAQITGAQPVPVTVDEAELLVYNGQGEADDITFTTPAGTHFVDFTPGVDPTSGSIRTHHATAASLLAFDYVSVANIGSLTLDNASGARQNVLTWNGTDAGDNLSVSAAGVIDHLTQNPAQNRRALQASTPGVSTIVLVGYAGDDVFSVASGNPLTAIKAQGGDPGGSDTLELVGDGTAINVQFDDEEVSGGGLGDVEFVGIELLDIDANGGAMNISGTGADESWIATPMTASAAVVEIDGLTPVVDFTDAGSLSLDGNGGEDDLTVIAPPSGDTTTVTPNAVTVNVAGDRIAVGYTNFVALSIDAQSGDDVLIVDSTLGLVQLAGGIQYDGGAGEDRVELVQTGGATHVTDDYTPGPVSGSGSSVIEGAGGITQRVHFTNVEPVVDTVPVATLNVNADGADNAVSYEQGGLATQGLVTIDGQESVEFANKTTLAINAGGGSDDVSINNPNTPTGLTGITVNGGDPSASDRVVVTGTVLTDAVAYDVAAGTLTVTGLPPVSVTGTEELVYDGAGGNDDITITTPAGLDEVQIFPGVVPGSGSVAINDPSGATRLGLEIEDVEIDGSLTVADAGGGRTDDLVYAGRDLANATDRFVVRAVGIIELREDSGVLSSQQFLPVTAAGIRNLTLNALGGDDLFVVDSDHPYDAVLLDGGEPAASDELFISAGGAAITVDLEAGSVTETGFGPIFANGVEYVEVDASAGDVTVDGTLAGDALEVTPTATDGAVVDVGGENLMLAFESVGTFVVNSLAGDDTLTVHGTSAAETIVVNPTDVTVGLLLPVNYDGAATESLVIDAGTGSDTVDVTPSTTTDMFVAGDNPIGLTPGDLLNVNAGGAATSVFSGPEPDSGGVSVAGSLPVSYDEIESLSITGAPVAVINGTNGPDAITIIARDAGTHAGADGVQDFTTSVNANPEILWIDTPAIIVNALSGSDEIAVRTPAPNLANWDVDVTINGDLPSASDRLIVETPGTQGVTYTPTDSETATLEIDGPDTTIINIETIEELVYDGEAGDDTITLVGPAVLGDFVYQPGEVADAGVLRFDPFLPIEWQNLGLAGGVAVESNAIGDMLVIEGTEYDDDVEIDAAASTVTFGAHVPLSHNLAADDALVVLGGDPSSSYSDAVTVFGTAGADAVGIDVFLQTVTGLGVPVLLDGVEDLTLSGAGGVDAVTLDGMGESTFSDLQTVAISVAGASTLTVNDTPDDDVLTVAPTDADSGRITANGVTPTVNYFGVGGTLLADLGVAGGADVLELLGTEAGDTVASTAAAISVNGGAVTIGGGATRVDLYTFDGDDAIGLGAYVGGIPVTTWAGDGDDAVTGTPGVDVIYGQAGDDAILGGAGADVIRGGEGDDELVGNGGDDEIYGDAGNDLITGSGGDDILTGGEDSDTFVWEENDDSDVIKGGGDDDMLLMTTDDATGDRMVLRRATVDESTGNGFTPGADGSRELILERTNELVPAAFNVEQIMGEVEQINLYTVGGADNVIVEDLTGSDLLRLNIDTGEEPIGAEEEDNVVMHGSGVGDDVVISREAAGLVLGAEPDVLFVIDVSGSTSDPFAGSPVGDPNGDGFSDTILDGEIAGFMALNQSLIDNGKGGTADVGIVSFESSATTHDMDPVTGGTQLTTFPLADLDASTTRDVDDVLATLLSGGGTDFESALTEAIAWFTAVGTPVGEGNLIFISDGFPGSPGAHTDEVATLAGMGINMRAFGAGGGASLTELQIIDPSAEIFLTSDDLLEVFGAGLDAEQETLAPVRVAGLQYDTYIYNSTDDDLLTVKGDAGDDSIKAEPGVEDNIGIRLEGGEGEDFLSADATLVGGDGDDVLESGLGDDTIIGGDGIDRVLARGDVDFVLTTTLPAVPYDGTLTGLGTDTLISIEEAELHGGVSDNTFDIGAWIGHVIIETDQSSDTLDLSASGSAVTVDLDQTQHTVSDPQMINDDGLTLLLLDRMENVVGSAFNDKIYADALFVPRSVDGGPHVANPPGDKLTVDGRQEFVEVVRTDADSGTVTAFEFDPISFDNIEKLAVVNSLGTTGLGGPLTNEAYTSEVSYPVAGKKPRSTAAGDLNGDGWVDLVAVTQRKASTIEVLLAKGDGTYEPTSSTPTGGKKTWSLKLADMNNDGDLDAVSVELKNNTATVYLGDGAGGFAPGTPFTVGGGKLGKKPTALVLEDVDNDGDVDVITANSKAKMKTSGGKTATVSVLFNDGTGALSSPTVLSSGGKKTLDVDAVDVDNDGLVDILATNKKGSTLALLSNSGGGVFAGPTTFANPEKPLSVVTQDNLGNYLDFNIDGIADVAVGNAQGNYVTIYLGDGDGGFSRQLQADYSNKSVQSIAAADVNSDGKQDVVLIHNRGNFMTVLTSNGNGTFASPVEFDVETIKRRQPDGIVLTDLNNDGGIDVAVADAGSHEISVLLKNLVV